MAGVVSPDPCQYHNKTYGYSNKQAHIVLCGQNLTVVHIRQSIFLSLAGISRCVILEGLRQHAGTRIPDRNKTD